SICREGMPMRRRAGTAAALAAAVPPPPPPPLVPGRRPQRRPRCRSPAAGSSSAVRVTTSHASADGGWAVPQMAGGGPGHLVPAAVSSAPHDDPTNQTLCLPADTTALAGTRPSLGYQDACGSGGAAC